MLVAVGFTATVTFGVPATVLAAGTLSVDPPNGRANANVNATYKYFDAAGACTPGSPVEISWDGTAVGTKDLSTSCDATFSFLPPPGTQTTWHVLSACIVLDAVCDRSTIARTEYFVDPTPTLVLSKKTGLATTSFTATYSTGENPCGSWSDAQFSWDGTPQGPLVPLDATCHAVMKFDPIPSPNAPGKHSVSAIACNSDGCREFRMSATFTVKPTPTPTPTPKPTPTPTPRPTPTPTAAPTASPSPSPSIEPSVLPSPSEPPSPSPTGEVKAGETSPPQPTPSPDGGAVIPPSTPPGGSNTYVPAIVNYIGGPDSGSIDPAVVATNLFLTLLVIFFFGLTAEVFNSTMDANRDSVHAGWARLLRGPLALLAAMNISGTSLGHLSGSGRIGSIARILLVLSLLGIIYGFLSPDFGWNPQSLILIVSLIVGLGFLTGFSEGSATRLATTRYRADASIKLYGTAIVVAILAVVVSRLVEFSPGLVYGFIASAVIVAPVALARRDDATLVLVPALGVLVVSLLAWLLLGPVRAAAAGGEPLPALAETILAMIMIGGLEGLFITMLPLTFMDGATVKNWSRVGWALVFGTVTFLWWQLLLNQEASYASAFEQTNVRVVLATLGVFALTTGGLWSYFRFRPKAAQAGA